MQTPGGIDLDVLRFGFCDFFAARGHLIARLEAEHADLGSAETMSVSCAVDSDIAAANDNYAAVECILTVLEAVTQILNSDMCAGCVVVLDSGASAALAADGDIERLVALLFKLSYRDILADHASFEGRNEYIERLCRFPLLILDDFGMERGTEYGLEQVYNVIDSRYRSRKPLIVTTNLSLTELQNPQDTAHARIYDRVLEMCLPILFTGENFRKETAQAKLNGLKELLK